MRGSRAKNFVRRRGANGDRARSANDDTLPREAVRPLPCRGSIQSMETADGSLLETAECNVAITLLETPACDVIYLEFNAVQRTAFLPHLYLPFEREVAREV